MALSSTEKVRNRNKNNSSIKPNKLHSKYVCFGSRKTREEQKILPWNSPLRLYGDPCDEACDNGRSQLGFILNSDWSIWIWARAQIQRPLALALKFKWTNQSWEWNHVPSCRCRMPHHKGLRKAEEVNSVRQIFRSLRVFRPPKHMYFEWNLLGFMELLFLLWFGTSPVDKKGIVEWRLASDVQSGLTFHSFRRRSNGFK